MTALALVSQVGVLGSTHLDDRRKFELNLAAERVFGHIRLLKPIVISSVHDTQCGEHLAEKLGGEHQTHEFEEPSAIVELILSFFELTELVVAICDPEVLETVSSEIEGGDIIVTRPLDRHDGSPFTLYPSSIPFAFGL